MPRSNGLGVLFTGFGNQIRIILSTHLAIMTDEEILRFDVSVDNMLRVDIAQCTCHFLHTQSRATLTAIHSQWGGE